MPAQVRRTLAEMISGKFEAYVKCSVCRQSRPIDLQALMEKVGPEFSLWNRSNRPCKITKGCTGRNRFFVGPGWHTKDYDEATEWRWIDEDWEERWRRA